MKESSTTRRILSYLNGLHYCHAQKIHGEIYSVAGTPDVFCVYRGQAILLEVKVVGAKPRPSQENQLALWGKAGAYTAVVYDLEAVKDIIAEIERGLNEDAATA